ncbi:MAG TPA: AarF/UbiB family protein [Burkholderiales bacterium]|nr:AarF/UbiB family protein [Burkholderiales bacterium]
MVLGRYKDLARLFWKYGRADLVQRADLADLLPQEPREIGDAPEAEELAADIERLGPTFIKLAQLLSTRPDIVPQAYADALARLQDHCAPVPGEQIEKILAEELGERLAQGFSSIDPQPLAAASLAQVHRATLRNGREVVIKVQRPGIRNEVMADLEVLGRSARFMQSRTDFGRRMNVQLLFEEFRRSLLRELDFRHEALHLKALARNLKDIPEIVVPRPFPELSTSRVLTMEFIDGVKVTDLSPLARMDVDGERLADALFRAYLKQMLRDGMFHADPHPGNVFIVGDRLALIDLGMVARITQHMQDRLLQLLLAVADNRPDDAAETLFLIGDCRPDADSMGFRRDVADIIAQHHEIGASRPQVGRAVLMLLKVAGENGVRMPPELAMIGKTLLNLDEIGLSLAPHFDPNAAIRRHAGDMTEEKLSRDVSIGALFSTMVEAKNFVQQLPSRVNRILDRIADNEVRFKVDTIDETKLMEGLQKVANRIATGLVLAALIVGAALMMDVPTDYRIFGYPGIAMMLFLAAAAGGAALVIVILANDIRAKRSKRL